MLTILCFLQESTVEKFLSHLNSVSPSINFTVVKEQKKKLPFLDVLVMRQEDGTLDTSVYQKKTHTDTYHSHHTTQIMQRRVQSHLSSEEPTMSPLREVS